MSNIWRPVDFDSLGSTELVLQDISFVEISDEEKLPAQPDKQDDSSLDSWGLKKEGK